MSIVVEDTRLCSSTGSAMSGDSSSLGRPRATWQFWGAEAHSPQPRGAGIAGGGVEASVSTTYGGLVMIFAGALLEAVAYLRSGPWRNDAKADGDM